MALSLLCLTVSPLQPVHAEDQNGGLRSLFKNADFVGRNLAKLRLALGLNDGMAAGDLAAGKLERVGGMPADAAGAREGMLPPVGKAEPGLQQGSIHRGGRMKMN